MLAIAAILVATGVALDLHDELGTEWKPTKRPDDDDGSIYDARTKASLSVCAPR